MKFACIERRHGHEELRVELVEHGGRRVIEVRPWWRNKNGELVPGRGATVRLSEITRVAEALMRADEFISKE
jgi:hypothetical protein